MKMNSKFFIATATTTTQNSTTTTTTTAATVNAMSLGNATGIGSVLPLANKPVNTNTGQMLIPTSIMMANNNNDINSKTNTNTMTASNFASIARLPITVPLPLHRSNSTGVLAPQQQPPQANNVRPTNSIVANPLQLSLSYGGVTQNQQLGTTTLWPAPPPPQPPLQQQPLLLMPNKPLSTLPLSVGTVQTYPALKPTTVMHNNTMAINYSHQLQEAVKHSLKNGHKFVASLEAVISLGSFVQSTRLISLIQSNNTYGFFIWIINSNSSSSQITVLTPQLASTHHQATTTSNLPHQVESTPTHQQRMVSLQLETILPIDHQFSFEINGGTELANTSSKLYNSTTLVESLTKSDITLRIIYAQRASSSQTQPKQLDTLDLFKLDEPKTAGVSEQYTFQLSYNQASENFVSHLQFALETIDNVLPGPQDHLWLLQYQSESLISGPTIPKSFIESVNVLKSSNTSNSTTLTTNANTNSNTKMTTAPVSLSNSITTTTKNIVNGFDDNFDTRAPVVLSSRHTTSKKSTTERKDSINKEQQKPFSLRPMLEELPPVSDMFDSSSMPSSPHSALYGGTDSDLSSPAQESRREGLIRIQTEEREHEYIRLHEYLCFIGTWNVNGQYSYENEAFRRHFLSCDKEAPDIYAIGFQELDLSKEAYLRNDEHRLKYWIDLCENSLHLGKSYRRLEVVRLIGMLLIVFVRKELYKHISQLDDATVGTGILGKMGNKGAVAIRFNIHDTSICFVNAHLAAHTEFYEKRNQDYREINSRLQFQSFRPPKRIDDHDQVYWFGDLNYRVDYLSLDQIKSLLSMSRYDILLQKDQLMRQKELKNCFVNYEEGSIEFLPTYKYNQNSDEWDSSEKQRAPAWCDRVLYRGENINLISYRSHMQLKRSDHKPVSAMFRSYYRVVDQEAKRKVYEDVMKRLDKEENDDLPQVEIDTTEINFGTVSYKDTVVRSFRVKNIGQSRIRFSFINKPDDSHYCKDWLIVTPYRGLITVGNTVEIRVELNFENPITLVSKLNYNIEQMYDTLVLRLHGGKDIFITVSGDYRPSSFGCSLQTLCQLKQPLASMTSTELASKFGDEVIPLLTVGHVNGKNSTQPMLKSNVDLLLSLDDDIDNGKANKQGNNNAQIPVPKELYMMVDFLYRNDAMLHSLFQTSGTESDFVKIRDSLDKCDMSLMHEVSLHSVAEALVLFLQCLPEPVIPYAYYERATRAINHFGNCKQLISELPDVHQKVFNYLVSFLKELCKYRQNNRYELRIIAQTFGPILIRKPLLDNESIGMCMEAINAPSISSSAVQPSSTTTANVFAGKSAFYSAALPTGGTSTSTILSTCSSSSSSSSIGSLENNTGATSQSTNMLNLTAEQTFLFFFLCNDSSD